jgi:hypothetical protein
MDTFTSDNWRFHPPTAIFDQKLGMVVELRVTFSKDGSKHAFVLTPQEAESFAANIVAAAKKARS